MRDQNYEDEESFLIGPKSGHDVLLLILCHVYFVALRQTAGYIRRCNAHPAKIIGVVLNKADIRSSDYYYFHYSYKNSYYSVGNGHTAQESSSASIENRKQEQEADGRRQTAGTDGALQTADGRAEGFATYLLSSAKLSVIVSEHLADPAPLPRGLPTRPARFIISVPTAGVAKLVYAPDSKSGEVTLMSVRVRPPAPKPLLFSLRTGFKAPLGLP